MLTKSASYCELFAIRNNGLSEYPIKLFFEKLMKAFTVLSKLYHTILWCICTLVTEVTQIRSLQWHVYYKIRQTALIFKPFCIELFRNSLACRSTGICCQWRFLLALSFFRSSSRKVWGPTAKNGSGPMNLLLQLLSLGNRLVQFHWCLYTQGFMLVRCYFPWQPC